MANNHSTLTGLFTDIADAIRAKTGGTDSIVADEFPEAIAGIELGENLDEELATQDNLIAQIATALEGKTGASGGAEVETCTIDVSNCSADVIFYTNENQECVELISWETTITVLKGTIMFLTAETATYSGGVQMILSVSFDGEMHRIVQITGDGSISS